MTIGGLIRRVEAVNHDAVINTVMVKAEPILAEQNRQQMIHGLDANGALLPKYKNLRYAQEKFALNGAAPFGIWDLRLQGNFQEAMFAKVNGEHIGFGSRDTKTKMLLSKVGPEMLGLSIPYKQNSIKRIRPLFIQEMKAATGL